MCPGGTVCAAASEAGSVVTNGMSLHARDGRNANAAVVVSVDGSDFDTTRRRLSRSSVGWSRPLTARAAGIILPRRRPSAAFWLGAVRSSWGQCSRPTRAV